MGRIDAHARNFAKTNARPYINCLRYLFRTERGDRRGHLLYPNLLLKPRIVINPRRIEYFTVLPFKARKGIPYFLAGDWDLACSTIEQKFSGSAKFRTARELIVDHVPVEKTAEFARVQARIRSEGVVRRHADALSYMRTIADLYRSIAVQGYCFDPPFPLNRWVGGVECALGRNLTLLRINAGNHRFAGAYVLGTPLIPVHVCTIHDSYFDVFERHGFAGLSRLLRVVEERYGRSSSATTR